MNVTSNRTLFLVSALYESFLFLQDWSEEVELQVRLEAEEAFSDAVTRSSSMTSLVETSTASQPPSSKKRNKR